MDNKLRFDFKITQQVIKKIGFIDSFKGYWVNIEVGESKYLKELRRIATIQSIGSSTRIEGVTLTNTEIETLLHNLEITKLRSRDEQEVFGYYEALETILENYEDIELTEGNVFNLHNLLLKFSDKDQNHRGRYKQLSNKVVARYPGGSQRVIFNTTEPFLVKKEMETLISWTNKNLGKEEIHPLITIGTFVYEFLSIHPFQDGNGRLSRLLTSLLLLKSGYHFIQYISLENEIEKKKKEYYSVLMDAQQHRNTESEIIDKWMIFFLERLEEVIKKLETTYKEFREKGPYLNQRQKNILEFIRKNQPIKIKDLSDRFTDESRNTIKKDLQYFQAERLISKIGKGRGTFYILRTDEEE